MAHMFPPDGCDPDTVSYAELNLYKLFAEKLDQQFYIIQSARWHIVGESGNPQDGEADFLIIHPDFGILIVEVKGGIVERKNRRWFQTNRKTNVRKPLIMDPLRQALRSAKALKRIISRSVLTKNISKHESEVGYIAWFPDIHWPKPEISAEGTEYTILDASDCHDPQASLLQAFRHYRGTRPSPHLSENDIHAFINLIEQDAAIRSSMIHALTQKQGTAPHLSSAQYERFKALWAGQPQVLIAGNAGTGKTVIAMEVASRLAQEGNRILVLVRSPMMANWLQNLVDADTRNDKPHFAIYDVAGMSRWLIQTGGKSASRLDAIDMNSASGQNTLASVWNENIREIELHQPALLYDGVIVDDGEDFEQPLTVITQKLLRDRRNGFFFVFFDIAQRMTIQDRWHFAVANNPKTISLTENWRNSSEVFLLMQHFYPVLIQAHDVEIPHGSVRFLEDMQDIQGPNSFGKQDEVRLLQNALNVLTGPGYNLTQEQILIITMRGQRTSVFSLTEHRKLVTPYNLRWLEKDDKFLQRKDHIGITTIEMVKGLEFPGVIIIEVDGLHIKSKQKQRTAYHYVGVSRAQQHLIVLCKKNDFLGEPTLWST